MARDDDDDDLDLEEDEDESEEKSADEPPPRQPRAKLSVLTIVLIFLNWIAAGAFIFLLMMDYRARQDWSYGVMRNYLAMRGLPLEDDEQNPGAHEALPRLRLDPEQLKESANARGAKVGGAFAAVDEPSRFQILPSHMTEQLQKDHFGSEPQAATLNDEVKRLRTSVPTEIKRAADEAAAKLMSDAEKRQAIERTLLPLAWDVYQVEKLHLLVKNAKGPELDDLVTEAYQRRIYADILIPLNLHRPGDIDKTIVEKIADLDAYRVDALKGLLEKRIDGAVAAKYDPEITYGAAWQGASDRDSIEKRQQIAFLLFTLSQATTPDRTLLFPKGLERAEKVSGLYEFAIAAQQYLRTQRQQEERLIEAIRNDREGHLADSKKAGQTRTAGFAERYGAEVVRLTHLVGDIDFTQKRLEDMKQQQDRFGKVLKDREDHLMMIGKKLIEARKETAAAVHEVRKLQRDLYEAQKTLADAADRNFKLEADIRRWEIKVKEGR